jgi:hypothetical protein
LSLIDHFFFRILFSSGTTRTLSSLWFYAFTLLATMPGAGWGRGRGQRLQAAAKKKEKKKKVSRFSLLPSLLHLSARSPFQAIISERQAPQSSIFIILYYYTTRASHALHSDQNDVHFFTFCTIPH